jgi:hypothetical protein
VYFSYLTVVSIAPEDHESIDGHKSLILNVDKESSKTPGKFDTAVYKFTQKDGGEGNPARLFMKTTSTATAYFDSSFRNTYPGFKGTGGKSIMVDLAWVDNLESSNLTHRVRLAHLTGLLSVVKILLTQLGISKS